MTGISPEALDLLRRYPWPGNVRELQSVVRQALLHSAGGVLLPEFLPAPVRDGGLAAPGGTPAAGGELVALEKLIHNALREGSCGLYNSALVCLEKFLLTRVLAHTKGNRSEAPKILGITRGSLRNKIRGAGLAITMAITQDDDDFDAPEMSVAPAIP